MTVAEVAGSFRDPGGFVFTVDGVVHRQVNERARGDYDLLRTSGLYDALVERGLLVAHEEVDDVPAPAAGAYRILRPEQVPFVSHPYEWCPAQLRDAALATLEIQDLALDHGMTLRDASAYNVQQLRGRPVLIDTLSFGPRTEGEPWVAYRQFCQHFLAPLALATVVDVRLLQLLRVHLDGIPLDLASTLLPRSTALRPGLGVHVHAHARSQRRHAGDGSAASAAPARGVSDRALRGLVDNLRATVNRLEWAPPASEWRDYYAGDSYRDEASTAKAELVRGVVADLAPSTVWDLGGNTGRYARLAAEAGADAVAFDVDPSAVQVGYGEARERGDTRLLTLVCDLANPSPALGWAHAERASLVDRGPVDLVLALALVHHLAIAGNVPLERIARFLAELAPAAVVEFVPKRDPKVEVLLASREDVFPDYTEAGFEAAFSTRFTVAARHALPGSERTLYQLARR